MKKNIILAISLALLLLGKVIASPLIATPVNIVAAENFYGSIAKTIGGKYVKVTSIISNPNADPHLFSTSSATAIAITKAQMIIYNGADYDPWMQQLLSSQASNNKLAIIDVAKLMKVKNGANPHVWYKPKTFPKLAESLAKRLALIQPVHKHYFYKNLSKFLQEYQQVFQLIAKIKNSYKDISITATEPVFNYMAHSLGMNIKGLKFQWLIMNGSEPSPLILANYLDLIKNKKVNILFYNSQVTDSVTNNVKNLAIKNGIPIIGVTETMPTNVSVISWFMQELLQVEKVLAK